MLLPLLALLGACASDNKLTGDETDPGFDDGDPVDTSTDPDDELCNGEDDDGDGAVDEGFPDDDGNGRVDCLDATCPTLELVTAGLVEIDGDCAGARPVDDPWTVTYTTLLADGSGVLVMPSVGHLNDDDGDGLVGPGDIPEIVYTSVYANILVMVDGATGATLFELGAVDAFGGTTIADVDGDGEPNVVAFLLDHRVVALEPSGAELWTTGVDAQLEGYPQPTVADIDEDGLPEVVADYLVLDGEDGGVSARLQGVSVPYRTPVVADLDQDGQQEILFGGAVWAGDGTRLWTAPNGGLASFSAVLDADGDGSAEVLFVSDSTAGLYEPDGTPRVSWTLEGALGKAGPPSVADFDGDGEPEIAIPDSVLVAVYETDGTPRWSAPILDTTGSAGVSGFDLDGDGAAEVLYADEGTFWIFDGATGAVRYRDDTHVSTTAWEYPVPVDADGDGAAEILVSRYSATDPGVRVYDHAGAGWSNAGTTWATHDYTPDRLDVDGSVPARPVATWQTDNVFRARPVDGAGVDLEASITDVCVADCDYGPVQLAVQVENRGARPAQAGVPLAIYAEDGPARLLTVITLPGVPAGTRLDGILVDLGPDDVGAFGFSAVVDDDGTGAGLVRECDESDNRGERGETFCP